MKVVRKHYPVYTERHSKCKCDMYNTIQSDSSTQVRCRTHNNRLLTCSCGCT